MSKNTRWLHKGSDRQGWAQAADHRILSKAQQEPNAPCVRRVLRMLQLMREAEGFRLHLYERCLSAGKLPDGDSIVSLEVNDPELRVVSKSYFDRLKEIERLGKRYRWSPTLRGWAFGDGLAEMFTWRKRTDDENWENWAICWLMKHAASGSSGISESYILRFRQCRQCSAWFYALTDHQHYCKDACRQKFHASSPEFRAKRARYMRERYRPNEKERERRAAASAKRRVK